MKKNFTELVEDVKNSRKDWDRQKIQELIKDIGNPDSETSAIRKINLHLSSELELRLKISSSGHYNKSDATLFLIEEREYETPLLQIQLEDGVFQKAWKNKVLDNRHFWKGLNILSRKVDNPSDIFLKHNKNFNSFFAINFCWFRQMVKEGSLFHVIDEEDSVSSKMNTNKTKIQIPWEIVMDEKFKDFILLDDFSKLEDFLLTTLDYKEKFHE